MIARNLEGVLPDDGAPPRVDIFEGYVKDVRLGVRRAEASTKQKVLGALNLDKVSLRQKNLYEKEDMTPPSLSWRCLWVGIQPLVG